jgi:hypothetical protein
MVEFPLLIGSFGASAVLLFGANDSPLTQPRNLVGGHVLSAIVAVIIVAIPNTGFNPGSPPTRTTSRRNKPASNQAFAFTSWSLKTGPSQKPFLLAGIESPMG